MTATPASSDPNYEPSRDALQAALRDSQARLRSLLAVAPDLTFVVSAEGRYLEVYAPDPRALIAPREALLTSTIHEQLPPDNAAVVQGVIDKTLETGSMQELEYSLPIDGEERTFWARAVPFDHEDGRAVLWSARDNTDQKRAQEERLAFLSKVQEAQKLESLGILAGGIAHDFNNLLTGVLGNVGLVARHLPPGSPGRTELTGIERAALRAAELCRQLLAYAGRAQRVVELLDLSRLVEEIPELLKSSISKRARLALDLSPGLPPVRGDATQLRQVVLNLVTNASEAISENGTIHVTTRTRRWETDALAQTLLDPPPAPGVLLELVVSDDGIGMDADTARRMFDPFFTTKFTGRGLGLAAVQGIVRAHEGGIDVDSEPGRGTTITVLLPRAGSGPLFSTDQPRADSQPEAASAQRVLVVDDDACVLQVAASALRAAGFVVVTARDGREAVETFAEHHDELACVLLDHTMPRLDGEGALLELKELDSAVPVILMSGFTEHDVLQRLPEGRRPEAFLQKPFTFEALVERIQRSARTL